MPLEMIKFGDVFWKDESEYVFLAATEEGVIYAAKILNINDSKRIENFCNKSTVKTKSKDTILFYWVKLTSKNLENRLAHFKTADSAINIFPYATTGFKLNEEDKKDIKDQILEQNAPLPGELKDLISALGK